MSGIGFLRNFDVIGNIGRYYSGGNFDAIGNIGKFYNYRRRATLLTWFIEIVQNNCENTVWIKNMYFSEDF